jgi:hypothetical protein
VSGIEVYQSPDAPSALPGSTRFAYRKYVMLGATPAGPYADYWRGPGPAAGLTTSNQATTGANFVYALDAAGQYKFVSWNFTGFSSLCIMVTEQAFGGAPPLLATGIPVPENSRLLISRYLIRWGGGGWGNANSGHVSGFWIGPAASGSITYVGLTTAAANGYIGLVRTNLGMFWGYKPVGGAAVLTPLPSFNPLVWAKIEHRFLSATITEDALYRLFINDILVGQVSFSAVGTPRYAALNNGVSPVFCQGNNGGFDTNLTHNWRDWEVMSGLNAETTL